MLPSIVHCSGFTAADCGACAGTAPAAPPSETTIANPRTASCERTTTVSRTRSTLDSTGVLFEVDLVEHEVERVGRDHRAVALRPLGRAARRQRREQRPRGGVA